MDQIRVVPEGAMAGSTGDYAGMSNDKAGENPARRKPKVSWGREIRPGLAGALVEAERRRRWTAGQHSCAARVDRLEGRRL